MLAGALEIQKEPRQSESGGVLRLPATLLVAAERRIRHNWAVAVQSSACCERLLCSCDAFEVFRALAHMYTCMLT